MLAERDDERRRISERLDAAAAGAGGVVLVQGAAGVGKSSLLRWAADDARSRGFTVLTAAGGELETELPFGVARQLLERRARSDGWSGPAAAALGLEREAPVPAAPMDAWHALYWALAAMADTGPLLVVVDDLHWADEASLHWLAYLARRLDDLPVLLVAGTRPAKGAAVGVIAAAAALRAELRPLGLGGIAELAAARLGAGVSPEFARACHELTAGNPLFAGELLRAAESAGMSGSAAETSALSALSPPVVGELMERSLAGLPVEATHVARAVAILGPGATPPAVAGLTGLDPGAVARVADDLRAAGLFTPSAATAFSHPIMRTAVLGSVPHGARSDLHGRAARLLFDPGAPPAVVAVQLLAADPAADGWAAERLHAAATEATASAAPAGAVRFLRRALDEPPPRGLRPLLLADLGRALAHLDAAAAVEPLEGALRDTPGEAGAQLAIDLASAHYSSGDARAAVATLDRFLRGDTSELSPVLLARLRAERIVYALFDDAARPEGDAAIRALEVDESGSRPEDRPLLVPLAIAAVRGGTADRTLALARAALAGGGTELGHFSPLSTWLPFLFMYAGSLEEAGTLLAAGHAMAQAAGSAVGTAYSRALLAEVGFRKGDLRGAEADADAGWQIAAEVGPGLVAWWVLLAGRVQARVARGDLTGARSALETAGMDDGAPNLMLIPSLRQTRARLLLAEGRLDEGVREMLAVGAYFRAGIDAPGATTWREEAAEALLRLGRSGEARDLATEALALAERFGSPIAVGRALRTAALTGAADDAREALTRSARLLAGTPARLEHAASLLELGSLLRRENRKAEARDPLREALDLATRATAEPLAARARQELTAAGARPRRPFAGGVESLTASELRIAQLAAQGLGNVQIAQELYVTRKTVEKHLGAVYLKLAIGGRGELARALANGGEQE